MRYTVRLLSAPLTTSDASQRPSPWSSAVPASIRPSRAPLWRALASLAVLGLALFFAVTSAPRLGLDLEGGTQIVLETQDGKRVDADRESTDRALEVLRGRVDALGVAEPTLARSGERRIIVELPGVQDPREAADVIGQTAQLGFHVVQGPASENSADGKQVVADESGQRIVIGPQVLDGNGVGDASAEQEQGGPGWWTPWTTADGGCPGCSTALARRWRRSPAGRSTGRCTAAHAGWSGCRRSAPAGAARPVSAARCCSGCCRCCARRPTSTATTSPWCCAAPATWPRPSGSAGGTALPGTCPATCAPSRSSWARRRGAANSPSSS